MSRALGVGNSKKPGVREKAKVLLTETSLSETTIAKQLGCSRERVRQIKVSEGLDRPSCRHHDCTLVTEEVVIKVLKEVKALNENDIGSTKIALGKQFGLSGSAISDIMKEHGIKLNKEKRKTFQRKINLEQISEDIRNNLTPQEIIKKYKVTSRMCYIYMHRFKDGWQDGKDKRAERLFSPRKVNLEQIEKDIENNLSTKQLTQKYNVGDTTIYLYRRRFRVGRRDATKQHDPLQYVKERAERKYA